MCGGTLGNIIGEEEGDYELSGGKIERKRGHPKPIETPPVETPLEGNTLLSQQAAADEQAQIEDKKKRGRRKSRRSTILTSESEDQTAGNNLGSGTGKKRLG